MKFGKNRLSPLKIEIENLNSELKNCKIMLLNRLDSFKNNRSKTIFTDKFRWNFPIEY